MVHEQPSPDGSAAVSSDADIAKIVSMLHMVITTIVACPEHVKITPTENGDEVTLTVAVAPEDHGKVVGKQGRTARSLRTIVGAAVAPISRRYSVNIESTDERWSKERGNAIAAE